MNDTFEKLSLDHTKPFITYIKTNNSSKTSKRFSVSLNKALDMLHDRMVYVKSPVHIVAIYTSETLYAYIQNRDAGMCQLCGTTGTKARNLLSKNKGGLHSPINTILCCDHCSNEVLDEEWIQKRREENILLHDSKQSRTTPAFRFPVGTASSLYFTCNHCNTLKYHQEFSLKSKKGDIPLICKKCKQESNVLKQNMLRSEASTISKIVQKYSTYIKQATLDDSSFLNNNRDFIYVIFKDGKHVGEIPVKLAKRYVEEGMSKFIKDYPFVIFHLYSTKRNKFRQEILARDNYTCHYCGKFGDTLDHILAEANGGLLTPKNSVCACKKCNNAKDDMSYNEFISFFYRKKFKIVNNFSFLYKLCLKCNEYRYHTFFKTSPSNENSSICQLCRPKEISIQKMEQVSFNLSKIDLPEKHIWIYSSCSSDLHLLNKNPSHIWKIQLETNSIEKIPYSLAVSFVLRGNAGILYTRPFILIEWNPTFKTLRDNVFKRDNKKCVYCSSTGEMLSYKEKRIDGKIPLLEENMWSTICKTCAKLKSDKSHTEYKVIYQHYQNGINITNTTQKRTVDI
ncbi:HNH endonuclease (plasmid) [Brevibacillus halotolerans]|nr:HNH endonuclease [Brevibacillus halotolerans]